MHLKEALLRKLAEPPQYPRYYDPERGLVPPIAPPDDEAAPTMLDATALQEPPEDPAQKLRDWGFDLDEANNEVPYTPRGPVDVYQGDEGTPFDGGSANPRDWAGGRAAPEEQGTPFGGDTSGGDPSTWTGRGKAAPAPNMGQQMVRPDMGGYQYFVKDWPGFDDLGVDPSTIKTPEQAEQLYERWKRYAQPGRTKGQAQPKEPQAPQAPQAPQGRIPRPYIWPQQERQHEYRHATPNVPLYQPGREVAPGVREIPGVYAPGQEPQWMRDAFKQAQQATGRPLADRLRSFKTPRPQDWQNMRPQGKTSLWDNPMNPFSHIKRAVGLGMDTAKNRAEAWSKNRASSERPYK